MPMHRTRDHPRLQGWASLTHLQLMVLLLENQRPQLGLHLTPHHSKMAASRMSRARQSEGLHILTERSTSHDLPEATLRLTMNKAQQSQAHRKVTQETMPGEEEDGAEAEVEAGEEMDQMPPAMLDNPAAQMTLMHQVLSGEEEGAEVKGVPGVKGVAEMVSQTSLLLQTHPATSL